MPTTIVEAAAEPMLACGIAGTTLDDTDVVAGVGRSQIRRGPETMRRSGIPRADVDTAALATLVLVTPQGGLLLLRSSGT